MDYCILDFGAVADGQTNCAPAIQRAIDACHENGGGRVVVPAGDYMSASIQLKSNVELHLENGATLISSHDENQFVMKDDSGQVNYAANMACLIGAKHAKNVALTGLGKIDGRGRLVNYNDHADNGFEECPLAFKGFRPRTTLFEDIDQLTVRDVTFYDSALWTLHMAGCRHVLCENIKILNDDRAANNDGIDPDCCQDVVIKGCIVYTGDDAIVIKSSKAMAPLYGACENITITGCVLHSRDSALKIGTGTWGDIRNIVFTNCVAYDCSRVFGIWSRDGAVIENIRASNLIGSTRRYADANRYPDHWWGKGEPIFINNTYRDAEGGSYTGIIRDIVISDIDVKCESSLFIKSGGAHSPIENIRIENVSLTFERQGTQPTGVFDESPAYDGSKMNGALYGEDGFKPFDGKHDVYLHDIPALYAQGVDGLEVDRLLVRFVNPENEAWTHVAQLVDCKNAALYNVRGDSAKKELPAVLLENCDGVELSGWRTKSKLVQED